ELPVDLRFDYPAWDGLLKVEATTDKDGKFRLEGLVPGLKYSLVEGDRRHAFGGKADETAGEPGKTTDAGDLSSKEAARAGGRSVGGVLDFFACGRDREGRGGELPVGTSPLGSL